MSETKGRCRSEVDESRGSPSELKIADAIDRLAADVAAVKEAVCGNRPEKPDSSPTAPQPAAPPAGWLTDEERHILSAHLQSLREQRRAMERGGQTLGYSANPCAIKREADVIDALLTRAGLPPVWLTQEERDVVEDIASMIEKWFKMAWSHTDEKRSAVLRSILARAGSPPVVEVPDLPSNHYARSEAERYRAAIDKAGVAWKEVGRE